MPRTNASDEAGFHGGKRAAQSEGLSKEHHDINRSNDAEVDNGYVGFSLKKDKEKFWVLARKDSAEKFRKGEIIPLMDIVERTEIFYGKRGEPDRASKAMLSNYFGDACIDDIIKTIIKEGSAM
mmetsp:Transcript_2275/g.3236  ORF Transcript_2275/g.3236 Transcript_2275/m.3236 type:complete len:124 (-) Transcript_2275:69-440(-)